jgi:hypothetical protein
LRLQALKDFQAVDFGQLEIEQNQARCGGDAARVRPGGKDKVERFFAITGNLDVIGNLVFVEGVSSRSLGLSSTSKISII